jgi:hypothetical protein
MAALIAASTMQMEAAAEIHDSRKVVRAPASEQFRNSNAYAAPSVIELDCSRYSGGISAPVVADRQHPKNNAPETSEALFAFRNSDQSASAARAVC